MKKFLENCGIGVNASMSKNRVKRTYDEIQEYLKSGQIPDYLVT